MVKKKKKAGGVSRRLMHSKLQIRKAWFRKGKGENWGFIPINWKGWVALILLVGLNVFAADYFNLNNLILDNYLRMGVVFLLSVFVFIEIAKKKSVEVRK
jgi:hypothetical protein